MHTHAQAPAEQAAAGATLALQAAVWQHARRSERAAMAALGDAVRAAHDAGMPIAGIARRAGINRATVRRCLTTD